MLGNLTHKVLGFFDGAQVGAHGNLEGVRKAQLTHGGLQLAHGQAGELAYKGGSHDGVYTVALTNALDQLEDLALVHNGAEGAVHQAHAAGNALVLIDLSAAQVIGVDGVHAAGSGAGALHLHDGVVGAHIHTLAALDALVLIDYGLAAGGEGQSLLGAHIHARVGQAAAAEVGHFHLLFGAGIAGELDNVHQRGIVVLLSDHAVFDAGVGGRLLIHGAQGQTHGQTDALRNDGALQENAVAEAVDLTRNNFVGQAGNFLCVVLTLIREAGHFGKDPATDLGNRGVDTAHVAHNYITPSKMRWGSHTIKI